jgi:hypothetical protein
MNALRFCLNRWAQSKADDKLELAAHFLEVEGRSRTSDKYIRQFSFEDMAQAIRALKGKEESR